MKRGHHGYEKTALMEPRFNESAAEEKKGCKSAKVALAQRVSFWTGDVNRSAGCADRDSGKEVQRVSNKVLKTCRCTAKRLLPGCTALHSLA